MNVFQKAKRRFFENLVQHNRNSNRKSSSFLIHRAIPEAGYIKLGTLRYGVRISNPNLSDYSPTNKSRHSSLSSNSSLGQPSSLIMSPSSGSTTTKSICNDNDDCCCIGGSGTGLKIWQNNNQHANNTTTKTRLPILNSGKKS